VLAKNNDFIEHSQLKDHHPGGEIMISVVIPAYNEAKRLPKAVEKIRTYLAKRPYRSEIIVVDDGSTDQTTNNLPDNIRVIHNKENQGKGFSVRKGVMAAHGDYIFFSDADLSTPIRELDRLLAPLQKDADIAIGSRAIKGAKITEHQPYARQLMGRFFNLMVRTMLIRGLKDTQCGFKGFRKEVARSLFNRQKTKGFSFDVEILYLAQKAGLKIEEIPVSWRNSINTKVNVFRDPLLMFIDLLRIRSLHRKDKKIFINKSKTQTKKRRQVIAR
jgi:dolichyl-phosphate beta-glucosyltransferase